MAIVDDLPTEILVHIFSFYVLTEKQNKLVRILRKVCKSWESASKNSQLWKKFDGTLSFDVFLRLCDSGEFLNTQHLLFSSVKKRITKTKLDAIYSNLPNLRRIDFSQIEVLEDLFFTQLQYKCPKLSEIVLSNKYVDQRCAYISNKIYNLLELRGTGITHIDISDSLIFNVHNLFFVLSDSCPNLQELIADDLDTVSTHKRFPITKMQKGCTKLKVLRLGYPIRYNVDSCNCSYGFPELEYFSHNCINASSITDEIVNKLLILSKKLKVLDLRGCMNLSAKGLIVLPAKDVQKLYISKTKIATSDDVIHLLKKWQHSLVELDISRDHLSDPNLNIFPWNKMSSMENLKISFHGGGTFCFEDFIQNCSKIKRLEIQGLKRKRRG